RDLERTRSLLAPWLNRPITLQPCLCDIWHDHVLFVGDEVAGIIDYGSCGADHVAADLARLLGSLAGDEASLRAAGLSAYRKVRPFSDEEQGLMEVLDRTGLTLGIANWLNWLCREHRRFEHLDLVIQRLRTLVDRAEASRSAGAVVATG